MIFCLNIQDTLTRLLLQEDTDGDKKITIEDQGPKAFEIKSTSGKDFVVKGTYHLSNLLQELVIAKNEGHEVAEIPLHNIEELPTVRVSRMIKDYFWKGLTRTMDEKGIENLIHDTKNETLASSKLRIYIPFKDEVALQYYKKLERTLPVEAIQLPEHVSPQYVKSINDKPGIFVDNLSIKFVKVL